jgi:hypothetical protein
MNEFIGPLSTFHLIPNSGSSQLLVVFKMCDLTMAQVRGVMLCTASALLSMEVINVLLTQGGLPFVDYGNVYILILVILLFKLVELPLYITFWIFVSGVLNRLPNNKGLHIFGTQLLCIVIMLVAFQSGQYAIHVISSLADVAAWLLVIHTFTTIPVEDTATKFTPCGGCVCSAPPQVPVQTSPP